jgi:hypothetical protein
MYFSSTFSGIPFSPEPVLKKFAGKSRPNESTLFNNIHDTQFFRIGGRNTYFYGELEGGGGGRLYNG